MESWDSLDLISLTYQSQYHLNSIDILWKFWSSTKLISSRITLNGAHITIFIFRNLGTEKRKYQILVLLSHEEPGPCHLS